MGRVVADRVAELEQNPVVGCVDSLIGFGVAVLEADERELGRHPREIHRTPGDGAGNRCAGIVHHEIGETLPRALAAYAGPPDLRETVLERCISAVLLADVRAANPGPLLQILTLQDPSATV